MTADDAVRKALERADEKLARRGMPAEIEERLARRLGLTTARRSPAGPARWPWAFAAGMAASAAVLVLALVFVLRPKPLGGFSRVELARGARVTLTPERAVELVSGEQATLTSAEEHLRLTLHSPSARVRKEQRGASVLRGTVEIRAGKRLPEQPPLKIAVSGGVIEVVGTHFTVVEDGQRGSVQLHEGVIIFLAPDGRARTLAAGQSIAWPLPPLPDGPKPTASSQQVEIQHPVEPPEGPTSGPTPPRKVSPGHRAVSPASSTPPSEDDPELRGDVFARIAELRTRGRFAQAVRVVEQALQSAREPSAREPLLWELSSILASHLRERERGCRASQAYLREFPAGRFANQTREAMGSLGCEGGSK